jgi:transglutaminase-like putative cysteine protease
MRIAAWALALTLAAAPARGATVPDWLAAAGGRSAPPGSGRASAVVLLDEQIVEVPSRGRTIVTTRWAVRVLARQAADAAQAAVGYARGASEVKSLRAWTLAADGSLRQRWDRKQAADISDLDVGQLYTDLRHLEIADDVIEPGQLFAFESVTEEEPLFAQWRWWFRNRYPCALSRFELRLPAGLEASLRSAHLDSARTHRGPGVWSWEMRDLTAAPEEPLAPARPDLGPYLCIQAVPSDGDRSQAGISFPDWAAVARWAGDLAAPQGVVTPEIASLSGGLVSRAPDSLARIRAVARYVQGLNYVAINFNIGRGWGYRPNEAGAVLRAGYGDCKDKANLLCTMLRAVGHDAWLMPVHSGSRDRVDSVWPSPSQFNHCIVAIRAPASYRGPVIEGDRWGRWLAFDPTDPLTAFGDLPENQQGSWGLLVMREGPGLVRLPVQPTDGNRLERRVDAALDPSGRLSATVTERSQGQAARAERALRRRTSRSEYQSALERWLPAQGGSVSIRSWSAIEDTTTGDFELEIAYDSPSFARNVGDRVLTFRSALLSSREPRAPTDSVRTMPIALPATCVIETLTVRLPEGFGLDERPQDLHAASDLGRLDATWQESGGVLVMARRWELRPTTVGPERWPDVRALFGARRASNEATVVLVKR